MIKEATDAPETAKSEDEFELKCKEQGLNKCSSLPTKTNRRTQVFFILSRYAWSMSSRIGRRVTESDIKRHGADEVTTF